MYHYKGKNIPISINDFDNAFSFSKKKKKKIKDGRIFW